MRKLSFHGNHNELRIEGDELSKKHLFTNLWLKKEIVEILKPKD